MTDSMLGSLVLRILAFSAASPLLQMGAIIVAALILEDAATILTALRVADGAMSAPLALSALYVGIIVGDVALYGVGRAAERHPWAARYLNSRKIDQARSWLGDRLVRTVFITRMLPGTRLPTYTACGFLRADFRRFVLGVIAATLVWTSLLFGAALLLGNYLLVQLGAWGWAAGPALAIAVLLLGRVVGHWRDRRSGLVQP